MQKINPQFIEYIESNNHEQKIVMCWTEQILAKQTLLQLQQKLQETNKLQVCCREKHVSNHKQQNTRSYKTSSK